MRNAPLTEYGEVGEDQLWENLEYFLRRVVPVAEQAGVKLAMHPDDPPLSPIRGLGRIMRSVDNFQRLIDLVPSPVNGDHALPGQLHPDDRRPARRPSATSAGRARSSSSTSATCAARPRSSSRPSTTKARPTCSPAWRAYRDIGFEGVLRPDHVPTMEGDSNDNPAYSSIGRLFAIGYIKGLREAVYGRGVTE